MLGSILSSATCATCGYCCSFKRTSLGETPCFTVKAVRSIASRFPNVVFTEELERCGWKYHLEGQYKTNDPKEEVLCPFLKPGAGCQLTAEEKPLECKLWPYRVMRRDGRLILAVAKDCPGLAKQDYARDFAVNTLRPKLERNWANEVPVIQDFREDYLELCTITPPAVNIPCVTRTET